MGSYDGAEFMSLLVCILLYILGKVYGVQTIGLYRDDGLACLHKINEPALGKIQKDIIRTFLGNFRLKITITKNL